MDLSARYIKRESDSGEDSLGRPIQGVTVSTLDFLLRYILPGNTWENGYIDSFNGTIVNEFLERKIVDTLHAVKILLTGW